MTTAAGGMPTALPASSDRVRPWVVPLLVIILLGVVLRVLEYEAAHLRYHDVMRAFADIPRSKLGVALGFTVIAYAVLPCCDLLALAYIGHPLPWRRVAYSSTVSFGISQTLGFAALTGGSLRVRLWSAWGLSTEEIARAVAFAGATFAVGILALTGAAGAVEPASSLERLHLPVALVRVVAAACLTATGVYVGWSLFAPARSFQIRRVEMAVPTPRLVAGQLFIAIFEWTLAALALFVLLPDGHGVRWPAFLVVFLLAQTGGLISHVPGGLGVFETLIVLQMGDAIPSERLLGALLAYRLVYYLIPFATALTLLVVHELRRQHVVLARTATVVADGFDRWAEPLLPIAMGTMTMIGGAILLFSGATPAAPRRLAAVIGGFPLGVVEVSHFTGSIAGTGLVVVGWALTRRLDAAYHVTRALLAVGIGASLLRGLDYPAALALAVMLALLVASRESYDRRSSLLAEPLTPGWVAAMVAIVAASVWIGFFSFKHVGYTHELWWQFEERGDVPRFLRASAGAATVLGVVALSRLLRHAAPRLDAVTPETLQRVAQLLPSIDEAAAALVLLGDKHLLMADDARGFLMFGVSGRSWVALGDPHGTAATQRDLAWRFRDAADLHGAWPVFYEVSAHYLPLYIDLGLTLLKLGETAIVPLAGFSLEGSSRRGLRGTHRTLQKAGASLEIVPAENASALLPELRAISDEWLSAKATREKGFSMGRFDAAYLAHFSLAIVRVGDRIVAFSNLWTGSGRELSMDLMRYSNTAPKSVMDYLFIEVMLWGRANGFERMSLGMAPLSGLEARALAPRWHRLGGLLYRHGEHFYNFQGLRKYKEKFDPIWEPRYLASPGGLPLPHVLANVTSLISGGITGLFIK